MNTITPQTYNDHSAYMNKENIASNMKLPQTRTTFNLNLEDNKKVEKINNIEDTLSKEDKTTLYFNLKTSQAIKNTIELIINDTSNIATLDEIYELNRKIQRREFLDSFQNQNSKDTHTNNTFEMWA